jgi:DNA-binding beta-propeller fold protein YncE
MPRSVAINACGGRAKPLPHPQGPRHLEYVFPDRAICVYDIDRGQRLVGAASLPQASGIRGVAVDPGRALLYVSYGGDGGPNGSGSLLKYDLLRNRVLWTHSYKTGIDSMALGRHGRTIYMPTGELAENGIWTLISARTGRVFGHIDAGAGPHNTIVGLSGEWVYLGGRNERYLVVASTRTKAVVRRVGPLKSGVRPFTVSGRETIAYTTATGFLGFEVSDLRTGTRLYTVPIEGFNWNPDSYPASAPSHGISLSPNERELYVIDGPNSNVHVFDVSELPTARPRQVANIRIRELSGDERGCAYDCFRDGWLQHSRNGRFVYVGDSGDVIDTKTRRVVAWLPALRNSRKALEIDWRRGRPVATTTRYGLGYVRQP